MDKSFQTSFIPKKPLTSVGSYSEEQPMGIFAFIAIVLFVGSLMTCGGVYVYKMYLTKQKESAEKSLIASRDSFEPTTINTLELFDKRTSVSKNLLSNHTVMSPFFDTLASSTISSIQYTKFNIDTKEKAISVSMMGVTRNYKYIALQSQVFNSSANTYFKNVVFSDLVKDNKTGKITFKVNFDVDPSLFSYSKYASVIKSSNNNTQAQNPTMQPDTSKQIPSNTNTQVIPDIKPATDSAVQNKNNTPAGVTDKNKSPVKQ